MSDVVQSIIDILAVLMVLCAMGTVAVGAIQRMIQFYQWQSLSLATLTAVVAFQNWNPALRGGIAPWLGLFALLIPGMLAYIIEPLLAQATVPQPDVAWAARLGPPFLHGFSPAYRQRADASIREALPVWLEHGLSTRQQILSILVSLALTVFAFGVAFSLVGPQSTAERAFSLAVALTLLMLGIFTMINRQDLISQIMGLLVMDHGLFLAVVRVLPYTSLVPMFVVSLVLYILITLMILVILLPELHFRSRTIEVADQKVLRG
jgi:hydrogenase-4 membrane subunit HyfE